MYPVIQVIFSDLRSISSFGRVYNTGDPLGEPLNCERSLPDDGIALVAQLDGQDYME